MSDERISIGILETGKPPADLEPRFGGYPGMFGDLLGTEFRLTTYDISAGEMPADPEEQQAFVVTGSPAGVYDDLPWIANLKAFLQNSKGRAKFVGICFGHQLMAEAFGGRVEKSEKGWGIGLHRYSVAGHPRWMDEVESFAIPASHQDQVVAPPPSTRVVAASGFTPFALLEYQDQPAISFQGHPEFDPAYAEALILQRGARMPNPDAALRSLKQPNDRRAVGAWIRRFLQGSDA